MQIPVRLAHAQANNTHVYEKHEHVVNKWNRSYQKSVSPNWGETQTSQAGIVKYMWNMCIVWNGTSSKSIIKMF